MSYETREVLWVLLYLAHTAAAITALVVFQRRAGAGRSLFVGGLLAFAVWGASSTAQTGYYLAAYYADWDYNLADDILPQVDLVLGGLLPIAGILLISAAVIRAARGITPPPTWTYPSRYVGSSSPFVGHAAPAPAAPGGYPPPPGAVLFMPPPPPPDPGGPGDATAIPETGHLH
ncbi:MAG: hypothetical protein LWW77_07995 [Propionibacteriales bacterium]|nr:hypothetical protein [Propionibacteriales bacterium]